MSAVLVLAAAATASLRPFDSNGKRYQCGNVSSLADELSAARVVTPEDTELYAASVDQYAYSSRASTMHPSGVVYCETEADVQKAVRYAAVCGFRVSVRSGGHQYSGLSSCNSEEHKCLQVDVNALSTLEVGTATAVVGPGVSLLRLYTELADHSVFVPGGECDSVHVGGHAQTGGAGIYSRSFGYFADHVVAFNLVVADGRVQRVTQPNPYWAHKSNDELFWAAFSGNAGSWGVVTQYELRLNHDADYPHSTYYQCLSEWSADAYVAAVKAVNAMVGSDEWPTDEAGDESVAISAMKAIPFGVNRLHVEGVWPGVTGAPFNSSLFDKLTAGITGAVNATCTSGPYAPSAVLRDFIPMGREREYPFPYSRKTVRGNVGRALGEDAVELFAASLDAMMKDATNGVYPVHQLVTFGGATNTPANVARSPLSSRDHAWVFIVDGFNHAGLNASAEETAADFVDSTWADLLQTSSFSRDRRNTLGPFGDLNIENVHNLYWDDATYQKLKMVKSWVDSADVFRTPFTIPSLLRGLFDN